MCLASARPSHSERVDKFTFPRLFINFLCTLELRISIPHVSLLSTLQCPVVHSPMLRLRRTMANRSTMCPLPFHGSSRRQRTRSVVVFLVTLMNRPSCRCSTGSGIARCTARDLSRKRRRLHTPSTLRCVPRHPWSNVHGLRAYHMVHERVWRHVVAGTR